MIGKIATLATDTRTHRSTLQVGRLVDVCSSGREYLSVSSGLGFAQQHLRHSSQPPL